MMAGLMLTFALTLFDYLGYWMRWHFHFPNFAGMYLWLALLAGPLFYLYSLATGQEIRPRDWWHALPALAMGLARMPFYLASSQKKVQILMKELPFTDGWRLPAIFFTYRGIAVVTLAHLSLYGWRASRLGGQQAGVQRQYFRLLAALYWSFTGAYFVLLHHVIYALFLFGAGLQHQLGDGCFHLYDRLLIDPAAGNLQRGDPTGDPSTGEVSQ